MNRSTPTPLEPAPRSVQSTASSRSLAEGPLTPASMALRLQTTLDLEQLLELFSEAAGSLVPHDGLDYAHIGQGIHVSRGRIARHHISYHLVVEGEEVGELRFLRGRRFRDPELRHMEELLSVLGYPLRHALRYQEALRDAQCDPLTGLYNRAAMDRLIGTELARVRRHGQQVSLLMLDLDHFKQINDSHGHLVGDRTIQTIAHALKGSTRKGDLLFRYAGEEFVVLMYDADPKTIRSVGERVRKAIRSCRVLTAHGEEIAVSASVGVTTCRKDDSVEDLVRRADEAMYAAKRAGRNRVVVVTP